MALVVPNNILNWDQKSGYYFTQEKQTNLQSMEELPIQYFLPNRLIHPADIVQTLNIPQDSQGNFCTSMKNEFESTFLETIMKVISSMFQKQINYQLSLMLSRTISL